MTWKSLTNIYSKIKFQIFIGSLSNTAEVEKRSFPTSIPAVLGILITEKLAAKRTQAEKRSSDTKSNFLRKPDLVPGNFLDIFNYTCQGCEVVTDGNVICDPTTPNHTVDMGTWVDHPRPRIPFSVYRIYPAGGHNHTLFQVRPTTLPGRCQKALNCVRLTKSTPRLFPDFNQLSSCWNVV